MSPDPAQILRTGASRAALVALAMAAVFSVLGVKAGLVATSGAGSRTQAAAAQPERARRADIVDRNGELLATSVTVWSLFADPRAIWDASELVEALATVFPDLPQEDLALRLEDRSRRFEWIRRGLTPRQRQAVFDLGLEGLHFRAESQRVYPRGTQSGHLLGHADVDGRGQMGVERSFDTVLARGGEPLRLTIDSSVQFALEDELERAAERHDTAGAAGLVIAARTGEIRALASWPAFDPNRPAEATEEARLNRATGALYELGSVFKPLTVAAALDAGAVRPGDVFNTRDPLVIAGKTITDTHPGADRVDVAHVLAESSNVGTVKIGAALGPGGLVSAYRKTGLMDPPAFEALPAAAPLLPQRWGPLETATLSFGHGIAVTPVAFARVFAAFANDGAAPTLTLVPRADTAPAAQLWRPETAAIVVGMLRLAVTGGTGLGADIPGYAIAGKTGTAEKPVAGGYSQDRNIATFAALFPAGSPEYVVLILLDDPKADEGDGATAARNAAPVAGRVIERIAPFLGVKPDVGALGPATRAFAERRAP